MQQQSRVVRSWASRSRFWEESTSAVRLVREMNSETPPGGRQGERGDGRGVGRGRGRGGGRVKPSSSSGGYASSRGEGMGRGTGHYRTRRGGDNEGDGREGKKTRVSAEEAFSSMSHGGGQHSTQQHRAGWLGTELQTRRQGHNHTWTYPHPRDFHQPPRWGQAQRTPGFPPGFGGASFPWQPTPSFPPPLLPSSFFSPSLSPSPFPSPFPSRQLHSGQSGRGRSRVPRHRMQSLPRPMVTINRPLSIPGHAHPTYISLLTYNVLAQSLIGKNRYLYEECLEDDLLWENRRELLWREVTAASADVVCFQEVEEEQYRSWFAHKMGEIGYSGVYKKRTGGVHTDGCALFYRSSRLQLLEWKGVEFQHKVKVLDRDNVGIVAKLRVISDWRRGKKNSKEPPTFCVATTHLLFNPKAGDVKLAQLGCLLAELHRMASSPSPSPPSSPFSAAASSSSSSLSSPAPLLPCLFCGDLNSVPLSPLLSFLESSSLDLTQYSAPQVAGYFPRRNCTRPIPIPLFPDCINIGSDCRYTAAKTTPTMHAPTLTEGARGERDLGKQATSTSTSLSSSSPEAVLSHPFSFMSAYPHPSPGHAPNHAPSTVTTYHSSAFETVDYILFTPPPGRGSDGSSRIKTVPSHDSSRSSHIKNGSSPDNRSSCVKNWSSRDGSGLSQSGFHLLSRQALPSAHTLLQLGPQPHPFLPSDHLCLLANLQLVWS